MRSKLIIEDGWIKEFVPNNGFFLAIFNSNRRVAKIKNNLLAEEFVEDYNKKHKLK